MKHELRYEVLAEPQVPQPGVLPEDTTLPT